MQDGGDSGGIRHVKWRSQPYGSWVDYGHMETWRHCQDGPTVSGHRRAVLHDAVIQRAEALTITEV